MDVKESALK
jgi:hypothetical protein